jgi:FkbM family methyltransferase
MQFLSSFLSDKPTIVEVGAFDGNDSIKMALQWPRGVVHSFEPVPEIYAKLYNNTKMYDNIFVYNYALSNKSGSELFYVSERPDRPGVASQAGSFHKPKERLKKSPLIFPRTMHVDTMTLIEWTNNNNIKSIDLLWLDTQGHEHAILSSAQPILKYITYILAEVSFIESYENQMLYSDLVDWLDLQGFDHVGRDFKDQNNQFFGNAFFVNRNIK